LRLSAEIFWESLWIAFGDEGLQVALSNHHPAANFGFAEPPLAQPSIDGPPGNATQPLRGLFNAQKSLCHGKILQTMQNYPIAGHQRPV
jgi:hypothetical protein